MPEFDINKADVEEIVDRLKEIDREKVAKILQYRKEHGPFKSIDELSNVPGFSEDTVMELKSRLRSKGEELDINKADVQEYVSHMREIWRERAKKIVQYRKDHPVKTLYDLKKAGISVDAIEDLKEAVERYRAGKAA